MTITPAAHRRAAGHRVIVSGGCDFDDSAKVATTLDRLHRERRIAYVAVGGVRGTGGLVQEWARARGVRCEVHHTDWMRLGNDAGRIRNERMLAETRPDFVVTFPGGSRTAHMVRIARRAGVEIVEGVPAPAPAPLLALAGALKRWAEVALWALLDEPPRPSAAFGRVAHVAR
jgi:hypothetical protein